MNRDADREQHSECARVPRRTSPALALCEAVALAAFALGSLGCAAVAPNLSEQSPELAELTGPFPDDYVEIVRRWIDSDFHDVSTVTSLQVTKPIPGHAQRWPSRKRLNGWYAKVTFKARDSVGANKGKLAYAVLLHEGAVLYHRKLLY